MSDQDIDRLDEPRPPVPVISRPLTDPLRAVLAERPLPPAPPPAPPSDWQRYLHSVLRHPRLVAVVVLFGVAAGVTATRFLDPRYLAKTILWIENGEGSQDRDRGPLLSDELLQPLGWVELVTSSAVLDSVVREQRLYLATRAPSDSDAFAAFGVRPRVRPGRYRLAVDAAGEHWRLVDLDGGEIEQGAVGDSVGASAGFVWTPTGTALWPGRQLEFAVALPYDVSQQLGRALKVRLDPAGQFVRIQLRGTDPALTAATLNAIARRVIVVAADLKRRKYEELERILGGQLAHADSVLQHAEQGLSDFRVRTAGIPRGDAPLLAPTLGGPGARDPLAAGALDLRASVESVRRDRRALEQVAGMSSAGGAQVEALAAIPAVQRSPELRLALDQAVSRRAALRALAQRYTSEAAPVQEQTAALDSLERRTIPALVQQLIAVLADEENRLRPGVGAAVAEMRRVPPLALEEARRTRDVASAEELFTNLRQRYEATQLALVSSLPDVRILDPAIPPRRPAADLAPLLIVLSFVLSVALAVLLATLLDAVDPKVRYPEQVRHGMRLSILAAVPHVRALEDGREDGAEQVVEAVRALRLRVLHANRRTPLELAVTSPGPGEGKSFVSANLALSFAHAGYRVVLVDGDVRRGAQHLGLGVAGAPGLIDVLMRRVGVERALQKSPHEGLWVLSAGTPLDDAPELVLSPRLGEALDWLRARFDVVVVDTPPLSAGADALALATMCGQLLLVVRAGTTDAQMALARLDVIRELNVHTLGAVLNDVHARGEYRYYTYADPSSRVPSPLAPGRWRTLAGRRT